MANLQSRATPGVGEYNSAEAWILEGGHAAIRLRGCPLAALGLGLLRAGVFGEIPAWMWGLWALQDSERHVHTHDGGRVRIRQQRAQRSEGHAAEILQVIAQGQDILGAGL